MKGVLRWLLGDKIDFAPAVNGSLYAADGTVISQQVQATVLQHGRLVSFLHQAIEWENINYFLYPYFRTYASTWDPRVRLQHQDPIIWGTLLFQAWCAYSCMRGSELVGGAFMARMVGGKMVGPVCLAW